MTLHVLYRAGIQAKQRTAWMTDNGIKVAQSNYVFKMRMGLLYQMSEKRLRRVEAKILQAAISECKFLGSCKIELSENCQLFTATFAVDGTSGSDAISKQARSVAEAWTHVCTLTQSYKTGSLQRSMSKCTAASKSAVQYQQAADTLGSTSQAQLQDMVVSGGDGELVDVTQEVLTIAQPQLVSLPDSECRIFKGNLNSFVTLAHSMPSLCGLMLGKKAWNNTLHVVQHVLGKDSTEALLAHSRVKARCEAMSLTPCGALVVGHAEYWRERGKDMLRQFDTPTPLLICIDTSPESSGFPLCWQLDLSSDTFMCCQISYTTQPKDSHKKLVYNTCWIDELGTSHVEAATRKIASAMFAHVQKTCSTVEASRTPPPVSTTQFRLVALPADGYCGWHALLASSDLPRYENIPKADSGYPLNRKVLQEQEAAAKRLHQTTCDSALHVCDSSHHAAIARVQANPSFSPVDLQWISQVLGYDVRCTCALEAGERGGAVSF